MGIVNNIKELKETLGGVQKTMDWANWAGFVAVAERDYVESCIGKELMSELVALCADVALANEVQKGLLSRLKVAVCYYAYYEAMPQLITLLGDSGLVVSSTKDTKELKEWQYNELRMAALNKADAALEDGLRWLEKHESDFVVWKNSDAYTLDKALFLGSATEMTMYLPMMKGSRRLYSALKGYVAQGEEFEVEALLGSVFFEYLKAKVKTNVMLDVEEKEVLKLLRYALANFALKEAVPFLNLTGELALKSGVGVENILPDARRNELKLKADELWEHYLKRLKTYMDGVASETKLAVYFGSETYRESSEKRLYVRKANDPNKPFFRL